MNEIEQFVTNVLESSRQAPEGRYYPALVVGLGGSGCRILRHLKRRLSDTDMKQIRLLGIDSDNAENSKFTPELPALADSEMALLHAPTAVGVLERAAAGHTAEEHVLGYLPAKFHPTVKEKINSNKGAGQFRRAGRLLFCSNVGNGVNLRKQLVQIKQELAGLAAAVGRMRDGMQIEIGVRVYVVGSLAGGTGAGAVIDCLALLRQHFGDQNDVITGVFVLPGELFDREFYNPHVEKRQTRGNALGTLREMLAFMVHRDGANAFDPTRHEFVFDAHNRGTLGNNTLVNDVYLVDHYTKDGRLASDIGDIFRAVSLFIYSLVGSGVGASQGSGMINGQNDMNDAAVRKSEEPPIFHAFGVGVIEYPVDDLLNFAARLALEQKINGWLDAAKDKAGDGTPDVDGLLTSLSLADLTAVRRALTPEGSVPVMTPGWRESTLKLNDAEFFEAANRFRQNVERDLNAMQSALAELGEQKAKSHAAAIEQRAKEWGALGLRALKTGLGDLRKHLAELEATRQQEATKRDRRKAELEKEIARRAKVIKILFGPLDKAASRKYLDDISELVQTAWHDSLDVNLSGLLDGMIHKVAELEVRVDQLDAQARSFVANNATKLAEIEQSQTRSCFVQSVLKQAEYRQWVKTHLVTSSKIAPLAGFQENDLSNAILEPLLPNFRQLLESLNLKVESGQNKTVADAIQAAGYISQPLLHLIKSAPLDSDMEPQHYVAGDFLAQGDPYVRKMFANQAGERLTESLPTGDRRRMVCVSTISHFAASHWRGFDLADGLYREDPWYYHVWPDPDVLPEIRPLDRNELALKRDFGLAMLFEMIIARGANFYRNLANDPVQNIAAYLLSKDQVGQAANALLELRPELVRKASTDRRKPAKEDLLGESLAKSLEALGKGAQAAFRQVVHETVDDFIERVGRIQMKQYLDEFVEKDLADQIRIAVEDSDRKRSLEEIRTALRSYAAQLA